GGVAARGKCTRLSCPTDRLSKQRLARPVRAAGGCIPPGPARRRLCRRPERHDRVSLGGRSICAAAGPGSRAGAPPGGPDRGGRGDSGRVSARAAKEATTTIPILFIVGPNPIGDGLVTSVSRPGGNATGVALYTSELLPKRLELLEKLLPRAVRIAVLVNPSDAA